MRCCFACLFTAYTLLLPSGLGAQDDNGLAAYKQANFEVAVPLLRAAVAKSPNDAAVSAALLSSLVYMGNVDEASALDAHEAAAFPASPEVIAARGEFAFYMADIPRAEKLWRQSIAIKETARAVFDLSRLYRAASFYRSARLSVLRAHDLDADDALINQAFLRYVPPAKRKELFDPFVASHPWLYKHYLENQESVSDLSSALSGFKLFETEGGPQETTLHLLPIMRTATQVRGLGLEFRIGNGRPLRMLFDTGASGILVKQSAIDKAGLEHIGSDKAWGIGDSGTRNMFSAVADTCQVGSLTFKHCFVRALEGKRGVAGDEDGLIGADFFQDYVVGIDFVKRQLHLKPLPPRPVNLQGYDRTVPNDESGFTPVFRFGHHLLILTKVNDKCTGLFLLDTGSEMSNIDTTFARLSTKVHGDYTQRVRGLSGEVKKVYEVDDAELQFGHFRQSNLGLISFNLNNSPEHADYRMSGILGIPVLSMFRLTIDYRNGLVNFDYAMK